MEGYFEDFGDVEVFRGIVPKIVTTTSTTETAKLICKSISDGCLPLDIFWALIGIVAGLAFFIFVILLCWCLQVMEQRKKTKQRNRLIQVKPKANFESSARYPEISVLRNTEETRGAIDSGGSSMHNVYINKAYIQDTNGQLKLIASEGVFFPPENNEAMDIPSQIMMHPSKIKTVQNREEQNHSRSRTIPTISGSLEQSKTESRADYATLISERSKTLVRPPTPPPRPPTLLNHFFSTHERSYFNITERRNVHNRSTNLTSSHPTISSNLISNSSGQPFPSPRKSISVKVDKSLKDQQHTYQHKKVSSDSSNTLQSRCSQESIETNERITGSEEDSENWDNYTDHIVYQSPVQSHTKQTTAMYV